jgi:hypothetical protein
MLGQARLQFIQRRDRRTVGSLGPRRLRQEATERKEEPQDVHALVLRYLLPFAKPEKEWLA